MDGKWTIHPARSHRQRRLLRPRARSGCAPSAIVAAYREATEARHGAVMFQGEMIDEANRGMAERVVEAGGAAGYTQT